MPKPVTTYVCQSCGAVTRQFFGRCSQCGDWNSIVEQFESFESQSKQRKRKNFNNFQSISESIDAYEESHLTRFKTGYQELDRVLGGGLVPGSLVLVGGDPGIGKSTLLLQSATAIAKKDTVLYVSGEESAQQVRLRWQRLNFKTSNLKLLSETNLEIILQELESLKPAVAVIDSVQSIQDNNLSGTAGTVGQVRECSAALQKIAKSQNTSIFLVGHVTKEGMLAGPKVLEHLVDVVITFEGDRFASHRLLRAVKNRFGATNELGVFEMQGEGLCEITNPSEIFLSRDNASGLSTIVACEGTRSIAIELQALTSQTSYSTPRRTATGIETNRLHQILAVLEKHIGLNLSRFDCYLAVAGGVEVEEPAADLGIAAAIVSSFQGLKIPSETVLIGEIGLGGQLRSVSQISQRLLEAHRLGFKKAVIPMGSGFKATKEINLEILEAKSVMEGLLLILGQDITKNISSIN